MNSTAEDYHRWYFDEKVWTRTTFFGLHCLKSVSDMWNYQEILFLLKPAVIVEFGTYHGGSALYFALMMSMIYPPSRILSVDIDQSVVGQFVRNHPAIELLEQSSTSPIVADRVRALRASQPGPAFFILDSDHTKEHVLNEMLQIRPLTLPGDYVVVEDSNMNGHPIRPDSGPGPYEAIEEYLERYPDDFISDSARETKFGFTFAPNGFLIRR
jgi:cephalosporin hydroxylase